jgi:hypothetical protein
MNFIIIEMALLSAFFNILRMVRISLEIGESGFLSSLAICFKDFLVSKTPYILLYITEIND